MASAVPPWPQQRLLSAAALPSPGKLVPQGPHRHVWLWPLVTSPEGVEKEFHTMSTLQNGRTLPPPPPHLTE